MKTMELLTKALEHGNEGAIFNWDLVDDYLKAHGYDKRKHIHRHVKVTESSDDIFGGYIEYNGTEYKFTIEGGIVYLEEVFY